MFTTLIPSLSLFDLFAFLYYFGVPFCCQQHNRCTRHSLTHSLPGDVKPWNMHLEEPFSIWPILFLTVVSVS